MDKITKPNLGQVSAPAGVDEQKLAERRARNEADLRASWEKKPGAEWKNEVLDQHKAFVKAHADAGDGPPSDPFYRHAPDGNTYTRDKSGRFVPATTDEKGAPVELTDAQAEEAGYDLAALKAYNDQITGVATKSNVPLNGGTPRNPNPATAAPSKQTPPAAGSVNQ